MDEKLRILLCEVLAVRKIIGISAFAARTSCASVKPSFLGIIENNLD